MANLHNVVQKGWVSIKPNGGRWGARIRVGRCGRIKGGGESRKTEGENHKKNNPWGLVLWLWPFNGFLKGLGGGESGQTGQRRNELAPKLKHESNKNEKDGIRKSEKQSEGQRSKGENFRVRDNRVPSP